MRASYALVGLVVGIVMDEVIRRSARNADKTGVRRRLRQLRDLATHDRDRDQPMQRSTGGFLAQDYYDR